MQNLTYIDSYFSKAVKDLSELETHAFEEKIKNDVHFAKDVAFYIQAKTTIAENSSYIPEFKLPNKYNFQVLQKASSIAAILTIALGLIIYRFKNTSNAIVDNYINENWTSISNTMSSNKNELNTGIELFNQKKYHESLAIFEKLAQSNTKAQTYKGIALFKLEKIDQALETFETLASNKNLYANPGNLYQAIILLKRAKGNDEDNAKKILEKIIAKHQEGDKLAKEILQKLN